MYVIIGISFLIHILTILAIIVLYQRRTLDRTSLPSVKEDVETLHQSMEAFIDEIEKENEHLYGRMVDHIREKDESYRNDLLALEAKLLAMLAELPTNVHHAKEDSLVYKSRNGNSPTDFKKLGDVQHEGANQRLEVKHLEEHQHDQQALQEQQKEQEECEEHEEQEEQQQGDLSNSKFDQVKDLFRQGYSIDQIARELHMGKGEAALIVNLMKKTVER